MSREQIGQCPLSREQMGQCPGSSGEVHRVRGCGEVHWEQGCGVDGFQATPTLTPTPV